MPLDSVPATVSTAALEFKRQAARGQCRVDVGFWGGVIPGNLDQLAPLQDAGVLGFKCFPLRLRADDFPPVDSRHLTAALRVLRGLDAPLLVHAESAEAEVAAAAAAAAAAVAAGAGAGAGAIGEGGGRSYAGYSRPAHAESRSRDCPGLEAAGRQAAARTWCTCRVPTRCR